MSSFINGWTKESTIQHIKDNFKGRAFNESLVSCQYLTEDGKKCAVGLFIPEGHAGQNYQGGAILLLERHSDLITEMPLRLNDLLLLQRIHDIGTSSQPTVRAKDLDISDEEVLSRMITFVESLT